MRFARVTPTMLESECRRYKISRTPYAVGGTHIAENIAPACKLCNSRKTNMSVIDFAQEKLGKLL